MKVSIEKYNEIMDKLIKETKHLPFHEQLIKLVEEASKYKIIDKCLKK